MSIRIFALLALCLPSLVFAQFPNYYPLDLYKRVQAKTINNEELVNSLFSVLSKAHKQTEGQHDVVSENCSGSDCSRHTSVGYDTARRNLFGKIHLEKDKLGLVVRDVYCHKDFRASVGVGSMSIPKSDILNCEHTWPQSKFSKSFPKDMQKSDLHHLYPSDSKANNTRGNLPFADVSTRGDVPGCDDSSLGSPANGEGSNSLYFEPPSDHKGNVARALFYFSVRYKMPIDPIQEEYLRQWHLDDPADGSEIERNNLIEDLQFDRNPFIDMPELVNLIQDF